MEEVEGSGWDCECECGGAGFVSCRSGSVGCIVLIEMAESCGDGGVGVLIMSTNHGLDSVFELVAEDGFWGRERRRLEYISNCLESLASCKSKKIR